MLTERGWRSGRKREEDKVKKEMGQREREREEGGRQKSIMSSWGRSER